MNKKQIVHIISGDKFTAGYIAFMNMKMSSNFLHHFFIIKPNSSFNEREIGITEASYSIVYNIHELLEKKNSEIMQRANRIIASGIFGGIEAALVRFKKENVNKLYLQFWGGDFYSYRDTKKISKKQLKKLRLHFLIRRCAGIITLVPGDYDELSKIFPNKTPHYVASMPGGAVEDWAKFSSKKHGGPKKVLLGNSATQENQHIEAINILRRFKDQNIEVVCPLSYGDKEYAKRIAEFGKKKLGRSFYPILDFMERDKYFSLLSECEVGIFNNNRQQAMGNINSLIELGKKVFLNVNTSMWKDYTSFGIKIYNIEDIKQMNWQDLWEMPEYVKKNNRKQLRIRNEQYDSNWSIILNI